MNLSRNQRIAVEKAVSKGIKLGKGWRQLDIRREPYYHEGHYYDPEAEVTAEVDAVMHELDMLDILIVKEKS